MAALVWGEVNKRLVSLGLDRGVLYAPGKDPVAWNGLVSFEESSNGSANTLYRDGVIYMADADPTDFSGKLNCLWYPDELRACLGQPMIADGFFADNQKPTKFSMCYRTLIGGGGTDDPFGYEIHLIYNAVATVSAKNRQTINESPTLTQFALDLVATPVKLAGLRPTAHFTIDTRFLSKADLATLEGMLYGTPTTTGAMPTPAAVFDLLNYGSSIKVHQNVDGSVQITGAAANIVDNGDGSFTINNINASPTTGTIIISDGGTTVIVP